MLSTGTYRALALPYLEQFDADKDGKVTPKELVDSYLKNLDSNGNGKISGKERYVWQRNDYLLGMISHTEKVGSALTADAIENNAVGDGFDPDYNRYGQNWSGLRVTGYTPEALDTRSVAMGLQLSSKQAQDRAETLAAVRETSG
ncbi:MAG: hypothetical protein HY692_04410 [Cyanobacteria bacterium NC_groundwater_1444_Ag_S-0.65um_54_12]|nr:hypothetical protein [Cyanobacteria bacterium NC_groundwater_1444_Ag_S-0.65um_54_12]